MQQAWKACGGNKEMEENVIAMRAREKKQYQEHFGCRNSKVSPGYQANRQDLARDTNSR